jgi:hypothetical protein
MNMDTQRTFIGPIMPGRPMKVLQGKEITGEMVDSALAYNYTFRPAYLYLSPDEAHGKYNREIVASILRTFPQDINGENYVMAEFLPHRKYRGGKFEDLVAADGDYPGRSVDLWHKDLVPGSPTTYSLEGVALCGANKPATINLPPVFLSTGNAHAAMISFSIDMGSPQQRVAQLVAELPGLPKFERDRFISLSTFCCEEVLQNEIAELRRLYKCPKNAKEAIEQYATERGLDLDSEAGKLAAEYGARRQFPGAFRKQHEGVAAIYQFAAERGFEIKTTKDFERAEAGAREQYPAAFGIKEE